jgi:hypothetical protein
MAQWHSYVWFVRKRLTVGFTIQKEATMTKFKIFSAIVILSAAIAAPVFAQEERAPRARHAQVYDQSNFRGAYNQWDAERRNVEDFGFSDSDRSPPWLSSAHGG